MAQELFEEVISVIGPFFQVLTTIKSYMKSCSIQRISQSEEISNLKKSLGEEKHSNKILCKRYKRTAVDNIEINQRLKDKEQLIGELKDQAKVSKYIEEILSRN